MVLYHLSVKIIGRGSGRSAAGAAAYRAGGILRSAAYRSGDELRDETGEIVHDYTRKTGVVHSEIMLPKDAPPEFADREILWNAVEAREKRHDAQLAREIEVALQIEFSLKEQIEVLREYIQENFVDKGMIADFNIHNNEGNPHAHIMLTTRHVTPKGFGNKNREWNNKKYLEIWREKWADVNNRKFEEKGLAERIDHRSYKDRGIDREPTIHLGADASKLEKRGKRSKRGDINREIEKRNKERAERKKAEQGQEIAENTPKTKSDNELAKNTAEYLNELKESYVALEKALIELIDERNEIRQELPRLTYRAESMDEHAQNIEVLQNKVAELQETRQNLNLLQWAKKQKADEAIKHAEHDLKKAELFFKNRFYVEPSQAPEEIKRIKETVRAKETNLSTKNAQILDIMKRQDFTELEYHTTKLLAEIHTDKDHLDKLLQQMNKPPDKIRDKLIHERVDRRLNIIPDNSFQKVIENVSQTHAQTLTHIREQHKKREQLKEIEKAREQTKTRDLSRAR